MDREQDLKEIIEKAENELEILEKENKKNKLCEHIGKCYLYKYPDNYSDTQNSLYRYVAYYSVKENALMCYHVRIERQGYEVKTSVFPIYDLDRLKDEEIISKERYLDECHEAFQFFMNIAKYGA